MLETTIIAFAAALAIGIPAVSTAWAQSRIGAAGAGAMAERPEISGTVIILLAIPETMVILGFVVAYLILGIAVLFGFPFSFALPVFFTLPVGLFQIWQLSQIADGAKPNWQLLISLGAGLFFACGYLLAYAYWTN